MGRTPLLRPMFLRCKYQEPILLIWYIANVKSG